jgi:hypothetical protein
MRKLLGQGDLDEIGRLAENGDRKEYYSTLADWGYADARLSLGVVRDDTLLGRIANRYADAAAGEKGYRFHVRDWIRISNELMMGDYNARATRLDLQQAVEGVNAVIDASLSYDEYRRYHAAVFDDERWGRVGIDIWTPERLVGSRSTSTLAEIMWQSLKTSANWPILLPAPLVLLLLVWAVNAFSAKNPFENLRCTGRDVVAAIGKIRRDKNFFDPTRKTRWPRNRDSRRR